MRPSRRSPSVLATRALLAALVAVSAAPRAWAQAGAAPAASAEAPPAVAVEPGPVAPAEPASTVAAPEEVPPVDVVAAPAVAAEAEGAPAADPDVPPPVEVQTLGNGDQKIHLVDHGDSWSLHAESVMAMNIFEAWHEAGGPELVMKTPLDYPYTLSVHRQSTERIVERILEGYGHTLHYGPDGRLVLVRAYSPKPARLFKTPRLVESLGTWRQVEVGNPAHPDGRPEGTPAVTVIPVPPPTLPRPQPVPESYDDPMNPSSEN